jgi:hypothetical protein
MQRSHTLAGHLRHRQDLRHRLAALGQKNACLGPRKGQQLLDAWHLACEIDGLHKRMVGGCTVGKVSPFVGFPAAFTMGG